MSSVEQLSSGIQFDVAPPTAAPRLAARLGFAWSTAVIEEDESTTVVVMLDARPTSFARILRIAEEWVEEEGLGAIRFAVDGREYVLESGAVDWQLDLGAAA
jgi:hypothetical protein